MPGISTRSCQSRARCPRGEASWDDELREGELDEAILDAVWDVLVLCRRSQLDALREGFQGVLPSGGEPPCTDFSPHLGIFSPQELALRLRGREVTSGEQVLALLRWKGAGDDDVEGLDRSTSRPVEQAAFERVRG